jgi:PTH1 family peptidyl-tRNA hydrolase
LLVLGLGNPGERYQKTRHNVGYRLADKIAASNGLVFKKQFFKPYLFSRTEKSEYLLTLVKPLSFMNNSGVVAVRALKSFRIGLRNLIVVCDNMDLKPGTCRLKRGGGDAGHNGLKSIISYTGSGDFLRLYIGIGHPGSRDEVVDWVLGEPGEVDENLIDGAVARAAASVESLLTGDLERVMNELNSKA